jgi:hypothetical protein
MSLCKNVLYTLLLVLIFPVDGFNQDLANLKNTKPITLQGSISTKSSFYNASGISQRQDPFSYGLDANATLSFYGVSMPFSFTWYDNNKNYSHPFNQFGLSPQYKWITAHFGYRNVNFSEYTLNGHTFLGAGIEMNPGNWRLGFLYGKFSDKSDYDPYKAKEIPQLTRKGWALKAGYGTDRSFIDFSLLRIGDNESEYNSNNTTPDPDLPTPQQNCAMGLHGKLTIKDLTWETEGGISVYTDNSLNSAQNTNKNLWLNISDAFITINQTSHYYSAIRSNVKWKISKTFTSGVEYRRIAPDYKSMGAYFFNNDVENFTYNQSVFLFQNKVIFRGNLGLQHDNLGNSKKFTSKRTVGSANMSYQVSNVFGFDAGYSNFTTNQKAGTSVIIDSLRLYQVNENYTFTPRLTFVNANRSHTIMLVCNLMMLDDKNKKTASQTETNTSVFNLTYALGLIPSKTNFVFSLNYTHLDNNLYKNTLSGVTAGVNKVMANNKLVVSWNNSFMLNKINSSNGFVFNTMGSANYRFLKNNSISLNFYFIHNNSGSGSTTPSYNEYKGDLSYVYSF